MKILELAWRYILKIFMSDIVRELFKINVGECG
jgi:hypothetical protein